VSPGFPAPSDAGRRPFQLGFLALLVLAAIAAIVPFREALARLYDIWAIKPEYSHGILIPIISLFLLWRERAWIAAAKFEGSWSGLLPIAAGFAFWLLGDLAAIFTIQQYGFLLVLYGLVAALSGWKVFRHLWMPLLILVFMVPLPPFFSNTLSLELQLLSSSIGVAVVRLAGISVLLEGNVIDLGSYKLQVAEACDGLRYLFPLMTLAFILSYLFRAPLWKRVVLFASSVPIAILLNSFRIGVIGITVEYWGPKMAEGVLHDFEGWVVFMLSTAVLMLVAVVLTRIGPSRTRLRDALIMDMGPPIPRGAAVHRTPARAFIVTTALVAIAAVLTLTVPTRLEVTPTRSQFAQYPTHLGPWQGRQQPLDKIYTDWLVLDDYVLADYRRSGSSMPVNLYVAYYNSQRGGQSVHSPRSCLPGGGWDMRSFEQRSLPGLGANGAPLNVNRAVIALGNRRQVVYYWFQQRGRVITSEYAVKWYIFWDALTRNRTDGALVRLVAPVPQGMDDSVADQELSGMAKEIAPTLDQYVPG
jgi:exosortase D (VPLPA-CTERM-specific)